MARPTEAEIYQKYEGEGYPIQIVARHVEISEPMKSYALDKLKRALRSGVRVLDVMIVMDTQKQDQKVDFILDVNNTRVKVSGHSQNMYAAIDEAIARLERMLRRYHRKLNTAVVKPLKELEMNVNVIETLALDADINDDIEEESLKHVDEAFRVHNVIEREVMALKVLNQGEVVMKMELSGEHFMLYRAEEDQKLKVIYRRSDGNFAIIEPE